MSFQDSAFIFFIALLLFGPKKLPELARQLGKLMGEFRRASNEFRMQLDDELRSAEQAEKQQKIAALAAATPPAISADATAADSPTADTPLMTPLAMNASSADSSAVSDATATIEATQPSTSSPAENTPAPIASSGDLHLHPPATGLPVARGHNVAGAFDSLPEAPPDRTHHPEPLVNGAASHHPAEETAQHG